METLIEAVPPMKWVPFVMPAFDFQPSVLVIGRPLDAVTQRSLTKIGVVAHARSIREALVALSRARWNVVVTEASIDSPSDGLRFVRSFKFETIVDAAFRDAQAHHRSTWFVIRPLEGDTEFAILATRERWFLGNTTTCHWSMRSSPLRFAMPRENETGATGDDMTGA